MKSLSMALITMAMPLSAQSAEAPPDADPIVLGEILRLESNVLGERRTVRVSTPPSYARTSRPYPVMVVLDGEGSNFIVTTSAVRFLASLGLMPEETGLLVGTMRARGVKLPPELEEHIASLTYEYRRRESG